MFQGLRGLLCAGLLSLGVFGVGGGSVQASEYCNPCHSYCQYEWRVRYETRHVPYVVCETRYDHCGRPYHVEVTRYRCITVPVRYQVQVCAY